MNKNGFVSRNGCSDVRNKTHTRKDRNVCDWPQKKEKEKRKIWNRFRKLTLNKIETYTSNISFPQALVMINNEWHNTMLASARWTIHPLCLIWRRKRVTQEKREWRVGWTRNEKRKNNLRQLRAAIRIANVTRPWSLARVSGFFSPEN